MKKMHVCNEKCLFEKMVNVQHTWMKRHACSHVAVIVLKLHKTQDSDPMSGANSMHEPIFVYTAKLSIKYNEMSWSWDCFICYGLPKVTTEVLNVFRWDGIPAALMLEDQRWGRRQRCFGCCLLCLVVTTLMFWGDSDCCSHVEPCHYCPFCRCFCDYFLSSAAIQQQVLCISLKAVWQKMERCIIIFYLLKI